MATLRAFFLVTTLFSAVDGSSAFAQSASPPPEAPPAGQAPDMADIVVTAQKREQSLTDVPVAIQAFSGDKLARDGVKVATDIIDRVPGASFQSRTPAKTVLQLRGVAQNPKVDPSVAVYVDEVPLGLPGLPFMPNIDSIDLQRIEVLRGPQGTLYGQGAMSGTLRVITADPSFTDGLSGKAEIEGSLLTGGNPGYAGAAALNIPLIPDLLAGRVTVSYRHVGGWIDDLGRGTSNINTNDSLNIRAKLLITPTSNLSLKLSYWHSVTDTDWQNVSSFKNSVKVTGQGNAGDPSQFYNSDFDIYAGFLSWDLGFAVIENGLSYYKAKTPARYVYGFPAPPLGAGTLVLDTLDSARTLTNEFRIVSPGKRQFQWIAGVFYRDSARDYSGVGGFQFLPLPDIKGKVDSKAISIFGEASWGTHDDIFRLLAGIRYFQDDRKTFEVNSIGGISFTAADFKRKFRSVNPRLNITVKPKDGLMVYFNAAKGFRSGIINDGAQIAAAAAVGLFNVAVVQPDSIWTYEIGGKAELFDDRLILDGAVFYSDWRNFQYLANTNAGLQYTINGGKARIKGIEASITWRTPLQGLTVAVNAGYNDATFASVNPILQAGSPLFVKGARLPQVPRYNGSATLTYDAPLNASDLRLTAGAVFTFRGSQADGSGRADPGSGMAILTDAHNELSLRIGFRKGPREITAFANNVTNNLKSINSLNFTWFAPVPRTVGLRLSTKF